jgi:hypothetical protein
MNSTLFQITEANGKGRASATEERIASGVFPERFAEQLMNLDIVGRWAKALDRRTGSDGVRVGVQAHDEWGLRPHLGVKPLRGSSTPLVPRSVAALRVSATPPFCGM